MNQTVVFEHDEEIPLVTVSVDGTPFGTIIQVDETSYIATDARIDASQFEGLQDWEAVADKLEDQLTKEENRND